MAVLTGAAVPGKNRFDPGRRVFKVGSVLVDLIDEKAQDDALVADINPRGDPFAFHAGFGVDDHISAPAISAADLITGAVADPGQFQVKRQNKGFIRSRNKVEALFRQAFFPFLTQWPRIKSHSPFFLHLPPGLASIRCR